MFEGNATTNVAHDSPCFLGFQPAKHLPKADVGLLVDVDVPWFPSEVQANPDTFWAHIDIDVLKPASPMWTFPGNMRMPGEAAQILAQLLAALQAKATPRIPQEGGRAGGEVARGARRQHRARQEARRRQGQARRDRTALSVLRTQQGAGA